MIENTKIIHFRGRCSEQGLLVPIEGNEEVPFDIKRLYYIQEVPENATRGFHAHRNLEQILICLNGSIKIRLKTLEEEEVVLLNTPTQGLYINSMVWREMFDFSPGSVLLVLASERYLEEDYIRDYSTFENEFKKEVNKYRRDNVNIPFSTVKFMHSEIEKDLDVAYKKVVKSDWFIRGEACNQFEKEFSNYTGCSFSIGCGNGLDAITLILKAFDIGVGDEVIIPSLTFIATALAVIYAGATPVLVEVDEENMLIDTSKIESAITLKTKAIIAVHLYGQMCDMKTLGEISKKYSLNLIEDAAQCHGATFAGKHSGYYSDAAAYSFYPGKNLGALGDGGMVCTNNEFLAQKVRSLSSYGSNEKYVHECLGMNSRLDELQAAFLSVKLKHLDKWNKGRQMCANRYLSEIKNEFIKLPSTCGESHVWHLFVIQCDSRDGLFKYLKQNNINASIHYPIPIHKQDAFQDHLISRKKYPVAESLSNKVLSLPLFYGMTDDEITCVVDTINDYRPEM